MKPTLYLDLDGVLVDCDKRIFQIFGKPYDELDREYLWGYISDNCPNFYQDLPLYDHTKELYKKIQSLAGNLYTIEILTATPRLTGHLKTSGSDKIFWVRENLDRDITVNIVVGKENKKYYLRSRDDLLIDDNVYNIQDWRDKFGDAILHTSPESTLIELKKIIDERRNIRTNSTIL